MDQKKTLSLGTLGLLAAFGAVSVMGAHALAVRGQLAANDSFDPSTMLLMESAWTNVTEIAR